MRKTLAVISEFLGRLRVLGARSRQRADPLRGLSSGALDVAPVPVTPYLGRGSFGGGSLRRVTKPNLGGIFMRHRLLPLALAAGVVACGGDSETIWIRLVDDFDESLVQDSPPLVEPPRTEWRFDGEGSIEPEDDGGTMGWTAFNGVAGLTVRDGSLVGTTGSLAAIRATRTDEYDERDLLYGIEVRMRVSEGTRIGANLSAREQPLDDEAREDLLELLRDQPQPPLQAELRPGDDMQTYLLQQPGTTIRLGATRNVVLLPTDAEGADFEIESVRIVSLAEHLASIPSGPGWHGLAEIYRETLVARTPERIVTEVELPEQPWLDLSIGTIEKGPVTFRVTVSAGGEEESLLRRTVTTPDRWTPERLDLSAYAGQRVTLTFQLSADEPGRLGYWGGPVIRNSDAMRANDAISEDRAALPDGGVRRPKAVVLWLGDTLRRDWLQAYGHERENAPKLTALAAEGVVFEDNISQGSWTKVSVPSFLTSLYPTSHGITDIPDRLPQSVTTMSEAFRDAGYATWQSSSVPFSGRLSNLHQGVDVLHERGSIGDLGHSPAKTARTYVDRFLEWAELHHDVPFFGFIHTFDPHSPFEPYAPYDVVWGTPEGRAEYERGMDLWEGVNVDDLPNQAQMDSTDVDQELFVQHETDWYDGSILGMDAEIARLMEGLEELGIAEETLFIFIADHGEEFLEHGNHFHGNNVYGEMINVPLIMWWPGVLPPTRVTRTTESLDMMPTVLELAGIELPEGVQGQSLLPLIVDPAGVDDFGAIQRAAFSERVQPPGIPDMGLGHDQYAIVLDGWKLVKNENHPEDWPEYELYDHEADPINLDNVADEHPEIVTRLAAELDTWREYALSLKPPPDTEAIEGLSQEEIARLRSLGYIN